MKNKTYNKIIDGTLEGIVIFFWHGLMYCLCLIVTSATFFGALSWFINVRELDYFLYVAVPTVMLSLPLTLLIYYIRKAQKHYEIRQWRDFWMCFSTVVYFTGSRRHQNSTEIDEWIEENSNSLTMVRLDYYHFLSSADAMAFKLRWVE